MPQGLADALRTDAGHHGAASAVGPHHTLHQLIPFPVGQAQNLRNHAHHHPIDTLLVEPVDFLFQDGFVDGVGFGEGSGHNRQDAVQGMGFGGHKGVGRCQPWSASQDAKV